MNSYLTFRLFLHSGEIKYAFSHQQLSHMHITKHTTESNVRHVALQVCELKLAVSSSTRQFIQSFIHSYIFESDQWSIHTTASELILEWRYRHRVYI